MLTFGPLLPLVSKRHRERDRLIKKVSPRGSTVAQRPFAGMRYLPFAAGSQLLAKIAGTYAREVYPRLEQLLCEHPFDLVVDIGSAEGFFVVGLARRLPNAKIIAYELEPISNELCRPLAIRNGVNARIERRVGDG